MIDREDSETRDSGALRGDEHPGADGYGDHHGDDVIRLASGAFVVGRCRARFVWRVRPVFDYHPVCYMTVHGATATCSRSTASAGRAAAARE